MLNDGADKGEEKDQGEAHHGEVKHVLLCMFCYANVR